MVYLLGQLAYHFQASRVSQEGEFRQRVINREDVILPVYFHTHQESALTRGGGILGIFFDMNFSSFHLPGCYPSTYGLANNSKTLRRDFIRCIKSGVPIWVIKINDIHCRNTCLKERNMVIRQAVIYCP